MEGSRPTVQQKRKCSEETKKHVAEQPKRTKTFTEGNDPNHPVKLYCYGDFDLFHYCHGRFFKRCKDLFQHCVLVVGVTSDDDGLKHGQRTVLTAAERSENINHCRCVDQVISPCPWIPTVVLMLCKIGIPKGQQDRLPVPRPGATALRGGGRRARGNQAGGT